MSLSVERLRDLLDYDPVTGVFRRRLSLKGGAKAGDVAGCNKGTHGYDAKYRRIGIDGKRYYAHRLAWLHVFGEWPSAELDHKEGASNSVDNLREANSSQNKWNAGLRSDNKQSGLKGVSRNRKRWKAEILYGGKRTHIGTFDSPIEAAQAYDRVALVVFGEFAKTNSMLGLL